MTVQYLQTTNKGWLSSHFIIRISREPDGKLNAYYHGGDNVVMSASVTEDALKAYGIKVGDVFS